MTGEKEQDEERLRTPYDRVAEASASAFAALRRRGWRGPALILLGAGAVIAFTTVGITAVAIERTSSTEYCTGCHVYEAFAAEYAQTVHHENDSGIRAECGDCHIPEGNWMDTVFVKAKSGFRSVWAYSVGGIDTPEAFEARRAELAEAVWHQYERRESDFCANCHAPEAWDLEAQSGGARGAHASVLEGDGQCIDCHRGVAHSIPDELASGEVSTVHVAGPPGTPGSDLFGTGAGKDAAQGGGASASAPDEPPAGSDRDEEEDEDEEPETGEARGRTSTSNRALASRAGGGASFEPCTQCHGAFAPGREALAGLDLETFLARLENHPSAGGTVASLSDAERRALHELLAGG